MTEQHDINGIILNLFLLFLISGILIAIIHLNLDYPMFIHWLCGFEILLNIGVITACTYRLKQNNY